MKKHFNGNQGTPLFFDCGVGRKYHKGIRGPAYHPADGIDTLYLVTDHTSFYGRYGWEFLCMVQGDGEPGMTRMYIHRA